MITITINDIEYKIPTSWDELYWKSYVRLIQLDENKENYLSPILYTQRFLEIISDQVEGTFDEMTVEQLAELEPIVANGFNLELLRNIETTTDHFTINGITYSFYTPETINKITIGEQGYIEMAKQRSDNDWDFLTRQLAVLIRPATLIETREGEKKWKLDRFNVDEVDHRIKILEENLSVKKLIMIHNFFQIGVSM